MDGLVDFGFDSEFGDIVVGADFFDLGVALATSDIAAGKEFGVAFFDDEVGFASEERFVDFYRTLKNSRVGGYLVSGN